MEVGSRYHYRWKNKLARSLTLAAAGRSRSMPELGDEFAVLARKE
jgi:hypothetical protein